MSKEILVGTWKLASVVSTTASGEKNESPYGKNPSGLLTYSDDGRVTAMISYDGRKTLPASGGTLQEQANAFQTFIAYSGKYTIEGDKVVHSIEISWIQNYVDKELKRTVRFEGDRIVLTTPPTRVDGIIQTVELTWRRL